MEKKLLNLLSCELNFECILFICVIIGGMLVQKLDAKDLQFEKMNPFDGTMAYAQNKRQQVIMTEKWAEKQKEIFFSSMHPGKTSSQPENQFLNFLFCATECGETNAT